MREYRIDEYDLDVKSSRTQLSIDSAHRNLSLSNHSSNAIYVAHYSVSFVPEKYRKQELPMQTRTVRAVNPTWVAKLRGAGLIGNGLIQVAADVVTPSESLS